jgi:predicted MFS family arabinose efflux permease
LRVVTLMLAVGVWGFVGLAVDLPIAFVVGSLLAFAAGWGWSGLFVYAVVRAYPEAPAAATGVTQTGFSGGNVFGPVAFGWIVATWSYEAAWLAAGGLCAVGALLMWRGSVVVRRSGRGGSAPRAPSAVPSSDPC